ncbi:unnamed protein product [Linum tenue]|uniref:Uncharacterized protein n=1 Tax=Linum tenue TaxID=586396 RepID=A0AAV0LMU8_9ROSI|nr:unnamed protein product [Linum tenue]
MRIFRQDSGCRWWIVKANNS